MEILGEGLKAVGAAVNACALWWGLSKIAVTAALTYLVAKCDVPFDKVGRFLEKRVLNVRKDI